MDFIGERYYKLNILLLLSVGLWPYQISILKKIQIISFQTILISFLICQCNTLFVKQYSINGITKILMNIFINCIYIVKYNGCLLLSDNIKYIFDRVRYDWNMFKAQADLEVIRRYADNAKLYTISFIFFTACIIFGLLIVMYLPFIFDVFVPINESRQLIVNVEYFVDEETYIFAITTHIFLTKFIGMTTIIAFGTILVTYILHTCAMFQIASNRIEHIFDDDENVQLMPKNIKQYTFYNRLIHAIYIHRRAIDLTHALTNSFGPFYFVLLGFGVLSMSLSFFNFINTAISLDNLDLLILSAIILSHLYYIFLGNYFGQYLIDSSINVHQATYNAQWYTAPLYIQRLMLFVIHRSSRRDTLTAGLFDASLEGFATLMSMSVSYVMVLLSVGAHKENHE